MLDLFLLGHGLWLSWYWLFLIFVPNSFLREVLPRKQGLVLGILWGLGYMTVLLFPGYAFRRSAPAPLPEPARGLSTACPRARIAAMWPGAPPRARD
jgi:hypothetical protein